MLSYTFYLYMHPQKRNAGNLLNLAYNWARMKVWVVLTTAYCVFWSSAVNQIFVTNPAGEEVLDGSNMLRHSNDFHLYIYYKRAIQKPTDSWKTVGHKLMLVQSTVREKNIWTPADFVSLPTK